MSTSTDQREWLTVRVAAAELDCGPKPLYRAIRRGELKAARLSRRGDLRINREWLREWVERRTNLGEPRETRQ